MQMQRPARDGNFNKCDIGSLITKKFQCGNLKSKIFSTNTLVANTMETTSLVSTNANITNLLVEDVNTINLEATNAVIDNLELENGTFNGMTVDGVLDLEGTLNVTGDIIITTPNFMQVWVDPLLGQDTNNGFSAEFAVETLQKAVNIIKSTGYNFEAEIIIVEGTTVVLQSENNPFIDISSGDFGEQRTPLVVRGEGRNVLGSQTVDSVTTDPNSTLTLIGIAAPLPLTISGKTLEFTSGALIGRQYTVGSYNGGLVVPLQYSFLAEAVVSPSVGNNFAIYEPSSGIEIHEEYGISLGNNRVNFTNLLFTTVMDTTSSLVVFNNGSLGMNQCFLTNTNSVSTFDIQCDFATFIPQEPNNQTGITVSGNGVHNCFLVSTLIGNKDFSHSLFTRLAETNIGYIEGTSLSLVENTNAFFTGTVFIQGCEIRNEETTFITDCLMFEFVSLKTETLGGANVINVTNSLGTFKAFRTGGTDYPCLIEGGGGFNALNVTSSTLVIGELINDPSTDHMTIVGGDNGILLTNCMASCKGATITVENVCFTSIGSVTQVIDVYFNGSDPDTVAIQSSESDLFYIEGGSLIERMILVQNGSQMVISNDAIIQRGGNLTQAGVLVTDGSSFSVTDDVIIDGLGDGIGGIVAQSGSVVVMKDNVNIRNWDGPGISLSSSNVSLLNANNMADTNATYGIEALFGSWVSMTNSIAPIGTINDLFLGGSGALAYPAAATNDLGAGVPQNCFYVVS